MRLPVTWPRPGPARREWDGHESRLISSVGTVTRCGSRLGEAIRLSTTSASCLPSCSGNSRIVVSGGCPQLRPYRCSRKR